MHGGRIATTPTASTKSPTGLDGPSSAEKSEQQVGTNIPATKSEDLKKDGDGAVVDGMLSTMQKLAAAKKRSGKKKDEEESEESEESDQTHASLRKRPAAAVKSGAKKKKTQENEKKTGTRGIVTKVKKKDEKDHNLKYPGENAQPSMLYLGSRMYVEHARQRYRVVLTTGTERSFSWMGKSRAAWSKLVKAVKEYHEV